MLLCDLLEVKAVLDINPRKTSEDKKLLFFIEWASKWIEELLGRQGLMDKKERTWYARGTGTQNLALPARPVFLSPLPRVFVDENGYYGSTDDSFDADKTELVYGNNNNDNEMQGGKFCLDLDLDMDGDGVPDASRSGLLVMINNLWPRPSARQRGWLTPFVTQSQGNVKVVYTAGYTPDTVPSELRAATVALVAKMRRFFPLGAYLTGESYEDRSVSYFIPHKRTWLAEIYPMILSHRNWGGMGAQPS
jgi:hypothetical protein